MAVLRTREIKEESMRQETEAKLAALFDSSKDTIWSVDLNLRLQASNLALRENLALFAAIQAVAEKRAEHLTPSERSWADLYHRAVAQGSFVSESLLEDGKIMEFAFSPIQKDRKTVGISVIGRNVTERKRMDRALKEAEAILNETAEVLRTSEARYRTAFETSFDAIYITRMDDGMFIDVNRAFFELLGYDREELVEQTVMVPNAWVDCDGEVHNDVFMDIVGQTTLGINLWMDPEDRMTMVNLLSGGRVCRDFESRFRKKSGEIVWALVSASAIELDGVPCVYSAMRDISAVKAAEEEIRNLSYYDPLTCLPNRRFLLEQLRPQPVDATPGSRNKALLHVDLDNFKLLNDAFGHRIGDLLLQEAARRIQSCVHEGDTVARLGGDEFVLILHDLSEDAVNAAAQAKAIGERILDAVGKGYLLAGRDCRFTASIGIVFFGTEQQEAEEVLQQADIAMGQAKGAGRNTIRFFSPALQGAVNARAATQEELRRAIEENQLVLYYQPQVDHCRLIGAEALVRWQHPRRGLLPPGAFIALAEETGLIEPMGDWVLEAACRQLAAWAVHSADADFTIAVNISARQFRAPDFVERVLATIERTGADPQGIELELTESLLVEDVEGVIAKMSELKAHGLRFSLDDFGTGYSSLSYLKRLPLDKLKIDIAFVRDILADASSGAIAQAIISLGNAMEMAVIAEGVENEEQRDYLVSLGCQAFQGYFFSRPVPVAEFEEIMLNGFSCGL